MRVDADRQNYGQFVLTGSQTFQLMKGVGETLSGSTLQFLISTPLIGLKLLQTQLYYFQFPIAEQIITESLNVVSFRN